MDVNVNGSSSFSDIDHIDLLTFRVFFFVPLIKYFILDKLFLSGLAIMRETKPQALFFSAHR